MEKEIGLSIDCPVCGAKKRNRCRTLDQKRFAGKVHQDRHNNALNLTKNK